MKTLAALLLIALAIPAANADPGDPNITVSPQLAHAQDVFAARYAPLLPEQHRQPWEVLQIAHVVCDRLEGGQSVAQVAASLDHVASWRNIALTDQQKMAVIGDSIAAECPFVTVDSSGRPHYTFGGSL